MLYEIFEGNMERLEKKLNMIQTKCKKYGCEFNAKTVGEVFHEVFDEETNQSKVVKYFQVEASGVAKVDGWEFVATIEHNTPVNIIRSFRSEYEVPERYYTAAPVCEHCNSKRNRKDTYLVRNIETGEFKQVGKSCLKDFTNGLSAEAVAQYISFFDELIKGEAIDFVSAKPQYKVVDVLLYAVESVNLYGYVKSDSFSESTKSVVMSFLCQGGRYIKEHLDKGFDTKREGNKEKVEAILAFVTGLTEGFGYISNLKTLCSKEYIEGRDIGIVVSAVACYDREMRYQARKTKEQEAGAKSNWVGSIGNRITLADLNVKLLTSWDNQYGTTYLYQFTDEQGNIYIWRTGNWIDADLKKVSLKGTIKAHGEFNGAKQTELTRCRLS